MKFLRTASVLVLSVFVLTACDDDDSTTGVEIADLAGAWSATQFEYTDNANTFFSLDAVSDAGGTVSLDVSESGAFTGSLNVPGLTPGAVPIGGTFSISGQTLSVDFDAATEQLGLFGDFDASYTLSGDVLTFENDDTEFDFPDEIETATPGIEVRGSVPATLTTRFVR